MIFGKKVESKRIQNLSEDFCKSLVNIDEYSIESKYFSETGPLSLFAMSTIDAANKVKYEAVRLIERSFENFQTGILQGGGVFIFKTINNFRELIKFLPKGEDPRVFEFSQEYYVYYQIWNSEIGSTELYITELSCEPRATYKICNEILFHGKNWSPFEINGKLYFVHTYDPFFILEAPVKSEWFNNEIHVKIKDDSAVPKWEWSDDIERGFVTEYRGGSKGILIHNFVYFFGHRTHKKNQLKHTIFVARFDYKKNTY